MSSWLHRSILVAGLVLTSLAHADDPGRVLERAARALGAGEHHLCISLAGQVVTADRLSSADRAEAHRLLGLAYYFSGNRAAAKQAFFEFVRLDADAHLDPALVPPEAIVLLEEVRAERAAELAANRQRPRKRAALNLLPPLGQFQNQQRSKGVVIGGLWLGLLATNLATYGVLSALCDDDGTCPGYQGSAPTLRIINLVAGVGAAGTYLYGVIDGYLVMRRRSGQVEPALSVGFGPVPDGGGLWVSGRF